MQLAELKSPEVAALSRDTPVVFPIAALEQHGSHLPLFTDSMLLGEIIRRADARVGGQVVFAPLLWLGNSDHHLDFSGTLSAAPRAYLDMLNGLVENFLHHGFKRLIFINGHGGNDVPGRQAIFEVRQRHRARTDLLLLLATYWNLADAARTAKLGYSQARLLHACEWETSMIQRLTPQLVGPIAGLPPVSPDDPFEPASRAWVTQDRSRSGHIGDPAAATPAKGEVLFEIFTDGVVDLLERAIRWNGRDWHA